MSIPVEARLNREITPNTKLLIFSGPHEPVLMFMKAESVSEFVANATARLSYLEQTLKTELVKHSQRNRKRTK